MHFAAFLNVNAFVACDEAQAPGRAADHIQADRARDSRPEPVGGDDEAGPELALSVTHAAANPRDPTMLDNAICNQRAFAEAGAVRSRMIEQDTVERRPVDGQRRSHGTRCVWIVQTEA